MDGGETYRPVSGLAVAALVTGLLSAAAVFGSVFWVLPLVAVCLAVVALRELARPESQKVGRLAAIAGLALAVGFGTQGVAATFVSRWLRERRVEQAAGVFVDAVRQERTTAARRMLADDVLYMLSSGMVGGEDPVNNAVDMAVVETRLLKLPAVEAIRDCGRDATPRISCRGYRPDSQEAKDGWLVDLVFAPCAAGGECVVRLELRLDMRRAAEGLVERWNISKLELVTPAPARDPS